MPTWPSASGSTAFEPKTIRPWVSQSVPDAPATERSGDAPWTWVYSGNLGRAHEWETLLNVQALIEAENLEIRLLFQGGGPAWAAGQARAEELGLKRCEWRAYAPLAQLRSSLLDCRCCVASQRPAAKGLLWPSKMALLLTLPRPLLWVGASDGAIARELRKIPGAGVFAPGQVREIADWILDLYQCDDASADPPLEADAVRNAALRAWCNLIAGLRVETRAPLGETSIASAPE